jgi:hypothetical protein
MLETPGIKKIALSSVAAPGPILTPAGEAGAGNYLE